MTFKYESLVKIGLAVCLCSVIALGYRPLSLGAAEVKISDPEYSGADAYLEKDWAAEKIGINERTLMGSYERFGLKDPKWDDDARKVISEWVLRFSGQKWKIGQKEFTEILNRLDAAQCPDVLVQYLMGHSFGLIRSPKEKEYFDKALKGVSDTNHLSMRKMFIVANKIKEYRRMRSLSETQVSELAGYIDLCLDFFAECLEKEDYEGSERLIIENILGDVPAVPELVKKKLERLVLIAEAHTDDWVALTVAGKAHVELAWLYRGNGWASEVTEEGWKLFREHMAQAGLTLTKAWTLQPKCPIAPAAMIKVAGTIKTADSKREWFLRTIKAQFDFDEAYSAYSWFLRPRWGGSYQEMIAFGKECAATQRYDTKVPMELARNINAIQDESTQENKFEEINKIYKDKKLWNLMVDSFDHDINDPHNHPMERKRTLNVKMVMAYKFGDLLTADEAATKLQDKFDQDIMKAFGLEGVNFHEPAKETQNEDLDF